MTNVQTISNFRRFRFSLVILAIVSLVLGSGVPSRSTLAQVGTVKSFQKISNTEGGFTGMLGDSTGFGMTVASVGDVDGDGVSDLAVGADGDDDGGNARGAVWVLFLNANNTVKGHQKISSTEGAFTGALEDSDQFGRFVAAVGDLDRDGVPDLAVGAPGDNDGGITGAGAVWILFLNPNGTVKRHQKISNTEGGFTGGLDQGDRFGHAVASVGDLDGDGVTDWAVGAWSDSDGGINRGAVWMLFLNPDSTVKRHQKINALEGGFGDGLDAGDGFGIRVASVGDLDGDGVPDLAVGASLDDDGGNARGAVWMLFLNPTGTVKHKQKISNTEGGFSGTLDDGDRLGWDVASVGDLDGDKVPDLAVGARQDDDGGNNRGAVWLLFLNPNGTVKGHKKISATEGGLIGALDDGDQFGHAVVSVGDRDGDGVPDLAVGAVNDDDGGNNRGAVWLLFLRR
ncbi:MAG: FG-GAP repeat protein [Acidobacteria bacterium]|nr:FG-GAP repeat protein [Acidobacteriota bacterium]